MNTITLHNKHGLAYFHLALIYAEDNNKKMVIENLEQAVENGYKDFTIITSFISLEKFIDKDELKDLIDDSEKSIKILESDYLLPAFNVEEVIEMEKF